jgi:IS605 OrfB family transposase
MAAQLSATATAFADACNATLAIAVPANVSNNIKLHHLAYGMIRERFKLSANLAVRAVRRVAGAMTAAKKRKQNPVAFRPSSIDYDARIFDYREKDETVSLTVMGGRIHVPLVLGDFQRRALAGKKPTAATIVRKGPQWFAHIVVEDADAEPVTGPPMGVDLGIRNTAATSHGTLYDGQRRRKFKEDRARIRASLQSKGTAGAKRVLRRLSGYENRRIHHENHVLSKHIVGEAVKAHSGIIRLEQLVHIRQRCKIRNRHMNRMMSGWSFGQLQTFISYKATRAGIAVEFVNPAYTSQTCPKCGERGTRSGDVFRCTTCGTMHADVVGALNIAGGGVVNHCESRRDVVVSATHLDLESHRL